MCEGQGGEEEYKNFSNMLQGITSDYGWLFTEQYTSIKQITKYNALFYKKLVCIPWVFN